MLRSRVRGEGGLAAGLGLAPAVLPTLFRPVLSGATVLQEVTPLLWVLIGLSVGGAAITYGFLVYAIWRFRDPTTKRRNYG